LQATIDEFNTLYVDTRHSHHEIALITASDLQDNFHSLFTHISVTILHFFFVYSFQFSF